MAKAVKQEIREMTFPITKYEQKCDMWNMLKMLYESLRAPHVDLQQVLATNEWEGVGAFELCP